MLTRKMKDSGIEWIGEIPEDWEVIRNKYIFNKKNIKVGDKHSEYQLLSLTKKGIVEKDIEVSGGKLPASFSTYQAVETNDIVLCLFDIDVSAVFSGISKFEGMISSAYDVFSVNSNMSPDFYDYYFQLAGFNRSYIIYSKTLRKTINEDNFRSIFSIVPPLERQVKIARKLDHVVLKIENIINETQQSIEELKKYKQSLITEAVTKGLAPNVEMKDSGIEWIGEIPGHWNFVKLGNISTKIGSGKTPRGGEDVYSQTGIYFLRSQNIYNEGLSLDTVRYITNDIHDEMSNTKVQHKDILLNITGGSIGRATIYDLIEEANVNQHVCIIRPNQDLVSSEWIHYCLISFLGKYYVNYFQTGGNREGLNFGEIAKFRIPLPKIEEQKIVSKRLKEQTTRIDKLIEDKTKVIEELESYKKSLIYEYVTGKKEV